MGSWIKIKKQAKESLNTKIGGGTMRLMEFLSDRFKAKILSISVELFERIENKQKKDAPNGWLSDRCAAVPEIVAGVQLWGKRKANQKFLNAVSGLQWSTSENAYGVFISIIYRNIKNEIFWYSDFLEASYWPELKAAQVLYKEMPHFKDWRTEPVPAFIDQSVWETMHVFKGEPDFLAPRPDSDIKTRWFFNLDYNDAWNFDPKQLLEDRDEFIRSQPWLYESDFAVGFAGQIRPFIIVRNEFDYYLKEIPLEIRDRVIRVAKIHGIHAPLANIEQKMLEQRVVEMKPPKRVSLDRVEAYIRDTIIESHNPSPECHQHRIRLRLIDGSRWFVTGYFHHSTKHLVKKIRKLFDQKIDPSDYYRTLPHIQTGIKIDWVVMTDDDHLFLEVRNKDLVYCKRIPDHLRDAAEHHAKIHAKLFPGPLEYPTGPDTNVVRLTNNQD